MEEEQKVDAPVEATPEAPKEEEAA